MKKFTSITEAADFLAVHSEGKTAENPINLHLQTNFGNMAEPGSAWNELLAAIEKPAKYVALDLSLCTLNGSVFDPVSNCFTGKDKIVSIILPDAATAIADGDLFNPTFSGFTSLLSFNGKGLSSIGDLAFRNCCSLMQSSLPKGLISIGALAFYGCTKLALSSLPEKLGSIGHYAFFNCTSLVLDSLPSGLSYIGDSAFCGCTIVNPY